MDREAEVIHHQMEETRKGLQEKLETLEGQVRETVQETTQAVTGTVDAVKETVETVKESVQETVAAVKDSVGETVESVKERLNLRRLVHDHPWPMFAGATAAGFVGGRLLGSLGGGPSSTPASAMGISAPASSFYGDGYSDRRSALETAAPPQRSWWSFITDHYADELQKLKGLAIGAVGNAVREMVAQNVGPELAGRARELVDSVVTKLGGTQLKEPLFKPASGSFDSSRQGTEKKSAFMSEGQPQEAML